jgi:hypothetical protein
VDPHWLVVAIAVVPLLLLIVGMRQERKWRLVADLPMSRPGGVFIGLVEVVGRVRCGTPLTSFLAERACVWYRWSVEEHWSRTVTETSTDSKGNRTTTTRRESGWSTVASGGDEAAFELYDESGAVRVQPAGARVDAEHALAYDCGRSDPIYYGKGPAGSVMNSDERRRFTESVLPVDGSLYAIGQARERSDAVAAEIAYDRAAPMYVLSMRGERSVERGYFWAALSCEVLGLLVAGGGAAAYGANLFDADPVLAGGVGAVAYAAAWWLGWWWLVYNALVELRQRVRQGWANIEVQLKRRFDLISQLMPLVDAAAAHESRVQREVAELRAQLRATPPGSPGPDVGAAAPRALAVAEAYPQLKAQAQFATLHAALVDCEDRIALARGYFNDIATHWNTRLERFPDVLVARCARMRPQRLMAELEPLPVAAGEAPSVRV